MFILIINLWSDYLCLRCYKKPRGILMDHSGTSTDYHVSSGLLSTLGTAASSARAFSGSCHASFPVPHFHSSHLLWFSWLPHSVSWLCPEQMLLTPISIRQPVQQCCCGHLPTASPAFLGRKEGSRVSGREERSQMQESSEVTLLHDCLSFAFANSWVIIIAKTCSAKWVGE